VNQPGYAPKKSPDWNVAEAALFDFAREVFDTDSAGFGAA
jgi:hypothetical protein